MLGIRIQDYGRCQLYRHTWYAQGMSSWKSTGLFQGESCGPFRQTYEAKPGEACQQYGVLIYSEAR